MGSLISKQILFHGSVLSMWWLSRQLPSPENPEFDNIFKQVQHPGKADVLLSQHIRGNTQNYLNRAQKDFKKCKEVNWEIIMGVAREMSHDKWQQSALMILTLIKKWECLCWLHCYGPIFITSHQPGFVKSNTFLPSFFIPRKNLTSWQDLCITVCLPQYCTAHWFSISGETCESLAN